MAAVRVTTGSRLHFGLIRLPPKPDWGEDGTRYYGGAGVMIDRPGVVVEVRPSEQWSAQGPSSERAMAAAWQAAATFGAGAHSVAVVSAPDEHAGLGTGTQLELAAALAVSRSVGRDDSPVELAAIIGRGKRSAIGMHGFALGGFLAEAGKRRPDELSPLLARCDLPSEWRIVLLTPNCGQRWHGEREVEAFANCDASAAAGLDALLNDAVLPAARHGAFAAFTAAIGEFNARAGEGFRASQGGRYAHPAITELVAWLHAEDIGGAGQSSWGPTVFAWTPDAESAEALAERAQRRWTEIGVQITEVRNRGAGIEVVTPAIE